MKLKYVCRSAARIAAALLLTAALSLSFASCALVRSHGGAVTTETGTERRAPVIVPDETGRAPETLPEPEETDILPPAADRTAEEVYLAHPELTPVDYDSPALLPRTEDAGQSYIDGITFLCDSPFYWLKLYGLLSGGTNTTQVWTGSEGTMTLAYLRGFKIVDPFDNVERTIPETAALRRPPLMVITVGINGVSFMDEAYFKEEYINLIGEIKAASPGTEIILQSILPIAPYSYAWGSITNVSITAANSWMLDVAEECGVRYLDTFSALVGEDGNVRPELVMDDGLHENDDGLRVALEYIRTHAYLP